MVQIHNLRQEILQYLTQLRGLRLRPKPGYPPSPNSDIFYELLGTGLITLVITSRLLSAVGDVQIGALEHDALLRASEVKKLEEELVSTHGWASFYMNQKAVLAASIPATTEIWKATPGKIIEKWRFNSWCRAMHRQTCCDSITNCGC
jgi:hypothetical protein